jgi:hypothetical protein
MSVMFLTLAFTTLTRRGLPGVRGEVIDDDVAGYHHYPSRDRVTGWLNAAGLQIIDEGFHQEDGWGYRHFLLQSASSSASDAPVRPGARSAWRPVKLE